MILYNNIFAGGKTKDNIIKVTYAELDALGKAKNFDTSVVYQLTDYTISNNWAENKGVVLASDNHLYDILITARDNEFLNTTAAATMHDGETYFSEIELSQWKITYVNGYSFSTIIFLTPFINRGNPKGIIISLTDEYNNCCNFDFKNITFNGNLLFGVHVPDIKIDLSRTGNSYNNKIELNITNLSADHILAIPMVNNTIISGNLTVNKQPDEGVWNCNIVLSFIHIIDTSVIFNLKAHQSSNVTINCNNNPIEDLEIIKCTDTLINNGQYASYSTIQFLNAKTVEVPEHPLNYRLILTPEENKTITII